MAVKTGSVDKFFSNMNIFSIIYGYIAGVNVYIHSTGSLYVCIYGMSACTSGKVNCLSPCKCEVSGTRDSVPGLFCPTPLLPVGWSPSLLVGNYVIYNLQAALLFVTGN